MTADHGKMTKAELLRALTALEARPGPESGETARVLHELEVHQEELELQNFELRQTQQLLEDSRDRYAELYDFCPVGYLSLDYAGCIREVNLTAAALFGIERTRLTGKPLAQYIAEADRPRFYSHLGECRNDAPQLKTELKLNTPHGGREVELLTTRPPIANGGSALYRTAITDVTERKRAAEALRASHQRMRELALHLQSVREDERKRIAREIHDELGALLLAIKIDLDACRKQQSAVPGMTAAMQELLDRVDTAIDSVRRIATDLRPSVLDNIGVLAAVEWQAQEIERRTGIKCEVISDAVRDDFDLPPELATAIFRIVQEALSNVVRHSSATHVHIALNERADRVELHIADNGKGFDIDALPDLKTWGLVGMAERVRAFGGEFSVTGAPHGGAAITVTIPVSPPPAKSGTRRGRRVS